jgi:RNA polymerase sigma-70 factor (ECF subfamily)
VTEDDPSDEALLARVGQGDAAAFDRLYARYHGRLRQYFSRMLGADRAPDLVQEVFLRVIAGSAGLDGRGGFRTWLFTVAHNLCCNEHRQAAVRRRAAEVGERALGPGPIAPDADEGVELAAFGLALRAELARLDPARRGTFLLRFQEGFSLEEIGRVMGCPVGTVKSRLFYTTRLLAGRLQAFDPRADEEVRHG